MLPTSVISRSTACFSGPQRTMTLADARPPSGCTSYRASAILSNKWSRESNSSHTSGRGAMIRSHRSNWSSMLVLLHPRVPLVQPPGARSRLSVRNCDGEAGASASRASDLDRSAQRLDAVSKSDEPSPALGVGATDAVVDDRDPDDRFRRLEVD